jgi:hypothetical protein
MAGDNSGLSVNIRGSYEDKRVVSWSCKKELKYVNSSDSFLSYFPYFEIN